MLKESRKKRLMKNQEIKKKLVIRNRYKLNDSFNNYYNYNAGASTLVTSPW